MGVDVSEVPERRRYEISVDGELAGFAEYREAHGETRAFMHTEIDPKFEGRGLGGQLVAAALADVRRRRMKVLPICPFVKSYLEEHPEELDLLEPRVRRAFELPEPSDA